ncbi:MAG: hypothetical protein PHT33_12150 [bacterium]|nr:hypothetical protein [bacterium]
MRSIFFSGGIDHPAALQSGFNNHPRVIFIKLDILFRYYNYIDRQVYSKKFP